MLETGQPQDARNVGHGTVAAVAGGEAAHQRLGFAGGEGSGLDIPDQLVAVRRRVDDVGSGRQLCAETVLESFFEFRGSVLVEIEVDAADFLNVLLAAGPRSGLQGVHADVDIEAVRVGVLEPLLNLFRSGFLGIPDSLLGFLLFVLGHQNERNQIVGKVHIVDEVGGFHGGPQKR